VIERRARDTGAAMVMVVMAIGLLAALSASLLLTSSSDVMVAASFRNQRAGFYAADAMIERAMIDIASTPEWTALTAGTARSSFVDGPPGGTRTLDDGTAIDLAETINMAGCHKKSTCTTADLQALSAERPWGANNPQWQLYAYGWLRDMLPGELESPWYVTLMIAGHPLRVGNAILVRAEAFGPRNAHNIVELGAARSDDDSDYNDGIAPRILSWREVR
jgi:hypothetical protein